MVHTTRFLFRGGNNTDLKLITCKDKTVITSKLQINVLHWFHTYLFYIGMDIMEATIRQHLCGPNIRNYVCKEVTNYDICQRTK